MFSFNCVACGASAQRWQVKKRPFCWPCERKHRIEAVAAINQVGKAVRAGIMPPARDCFCTDCSKPAHDYDHRDYMQPLDVEPVCRSCNIKRGKAFNSFYRPQTASV